MAASARTGEDRQPKRWRRVLSKGSAVVGLVGSIVVAGYAGWLLWSFGLAAGMWVCVSAVILLAVAGIVGVSSVSVLRVPFADRQRRAAVRARAAKLTVIVAILIAPIGLINLWFFSMLDGVFSLVVGIVVLLASAATPIVVTRRRRRTG